MSVHTAAGKICNSHTNTPSLKQMPSCSTTKYLQVCKFSLSCTLENPLITMQRQCTFCTGQLRNGECCSLALNSIQSSGAGEAHATKLVPAIPHRLISYEMRQIWNHSSCDWVTICFASLEQLSEGSYIYIYFFHRRMWHMPGYMKGLSVHAHITILPEPFIAGRTHLASKPTPTPSAKTVKRSRRVWRRFSYGKRCE